VNQSSSSDENSAPPNHVLRCLRGELTSSTERASLLFGLKTANRPRAGLDTLNNSPTPFECAKIGHRFTAAAP
jgi:hypothetical protein